MNTTMQIIHQLLGNLVCSCNLQETYVEDADPWMVILAAADSTAQITYHQTKQKSTGKLFFGEYMILLINHTANWRYIS